MAEDFILNTLGFKTGANKHSDEIPELQAIDARLDAHTAQANSEGLITKGVNLLFKTFADGDVKSEKKLEELRAQVLTDLQTGNKAAIAALQPDIQKAVQADIQACQTDSFRDGASSFIANTTVAASMFVRGPRGRALSMTLNAANDIHTQDGAGGMAVDAGVGALKGYALSRTFETLGGTKMSAPMKGVAIGVASRLEDNTLTASNYRDQNGGVDIGAGVTNTLHETFNPFNLFIDAGTFGVGHVASSGLNASLKGALEKNPVAANVFTGFSIGLVSGMQGEFAQETSDPNASVNYGRVGWKGLESGFSNALSAFGGAKIEQTSTFAPGADLRHPGAKPAGSMMLPDATDLDARRPAATVIPGSPSAPISDVAPPVPAAPVTADAPTGTYSDLIARHMRRSAPVIADPVVTGSVLTPDVGPTAALIPVESGTDPLAASHELPLTPVAGVEPVDPLHVETAEPAVLENNVLPFVAPDSHTAGHTSDVSAILNLTDATLMAAAGRSDDPLRAANPKNNDVIRIGSNSDFRYLGNDPTGKQAIVAYGDKRTLAATGPVIGGTIESNGFRRIATAIPVEVNGVETNPPLYTKDGKARIYAAVPTADGTGFTERAVKGVALRDLTDLGTTDLENGPPGRTAAWHDAQFLRGIEIAGTNLDVVGHDSEGNDVVVRDRTKSAGSEPPETVDDLNHYRAVVAYDGHAVPEVFYTPRGSTSGELFRMEPDFDSGHYRATLQDDMKVMSREEAGLRPLADVPPASAASPNAHSADVMNGLWTTVDHPNAASLAAFTDLVEKNSAFFDKKALESEIETSGRSEHSRQDAQVLLTKAYKAVVEQGFAKITDTFKPGADPQARLDFQIWAMNHGPDVVDLLSQSKRSEMQVRFAQENPHGDMNDYLAAGPALIKDSKALIEASRDVVYAATPPGKPGAEARLETFLRTRYWGVSPEAVAAGAPRPQVGPNPDFGALRQPLIDFANSIHNGATDPVVAAQVVNRAFDTVSTEIGGHLLERAISAGASSQANAQLVHFLSLQPENVRDAVRAHDVQTLDGSSMSGHVDHLVDQADPVRIEAAQHLLQTAIAPNATAAEKEAFTQLVQTNGSFLRAPLEEFGRLQLDAQSRQAAQTLIAQSWQPIEAKAGELLQKAASPKSNIDDHLAFMEYVRQHGPDSLQRLMNEVYTTGPDGKNLRQRTVAKSDVIDPVEETRLIRSAFSGRPGVVEDPVRIPSDQELADMPAERRQGWEKRWTLVENGLPNDRFKEQLRNRYEDIHSLRASLDAAVAAVPGGVWPTDRATLMQVLSEPPIRKFMQDVLQQEYLAAGNDEDRPTVSVDRDMYDYAAARAIRENQPDSAYIGVVRAAYGNLRMDVPDVHPKQAAVWENIRKAITTSDPDPAKQQALQTMLAAQFRLDPLLEVRARQLESLMYDAPAKETLTRALDEVSPENLLKNYRQNFTALSERIGQMTLPQFAELVNLANTQGVPAAGSDLLFTSPAFKEALSVYNQDPTNPENQRDLQAFQRLLTVDHNAPGKEPITRAVPPSRMQQLANVYAEARQPDGVSATDAVYSGLPDDVVALLRQEGIVPQRGEAGQYGSIPTQRDTTILASTETILSMPSREYDGAVTGMNTLIERATVGPPNDTLADISVTPFLRMIAEHPETARTMLERYGARKPGANGTDWNKQHFELANLLAQRNYSDFAQINEVFSLLEQSREARAGGDQRNGGKPPDIALADVFYRNAVHDAEVLADGVIARDPDRSANPQYAQARQEYLDAYLDGAIRNNADLVQRGQPPLDLNDPNVYDAEVTQPADVHFNQSLDRYKAIRALLETLKQPPQPPQGPRNQGPRPGGGRPYPPRGGPGAGGPRGGQPPPGGNPPP